MRITKRLKQQQAAFAQMETREILFSPSFRAACERNACGFYGACWMCPPDVGEIGQLIAQVSAYPYALVFQTVHEIADSFDIEGMQRAARAHNRLIVRLRRSLTRAGVDCLTLGAGACGGCKTCAKKANEPCRHPDRAVIPLEAAGIDVVALARRAGLPYLNGKNTVTYFGAIFSHMPIA